MTFEESDIGQDIKVNEPIAATIIYSKKVSARESDCWRHLNCLFNAITFNLFIYLFIL